MKCLYHFYSVNMVNYVDWFKNVKMNVKFQGQIPSSHLECKLYNDDKLVRKCADTWNRHKDSYHLVEYISKSEIGKMKVYMSMRREFDHWWHSPPKEERTHMFQDNASCLASWDIVSFPQRDPSIYLFFIPTVHISVMELTLYYS